MRPIGRKEWIALPELGNARVEAKIDTGAYRTAIHCISCREVEANGKTVLEAQFMLDGSTQYIHHFTQYRQRSVRSSFGDEEQRYCVHTTLRIGRSRIRSEVSLSDRSDMKCQVLIGRKTLFRKFVVDVSRAYLQHLRKPKSS
jgi:hypothetical protein